MKLAALTNRPVSTITDTELEAVNTDLHKLTGCTIGREGFSDYHLAWFEWSWTPDGYQTSDLTTGKGSCWPLDPDLPIFRIVELATHLREALPKP